MLLRQLSGCLLLTLLSGCLSDGLSPFRDGSEPEVAIDPDEAPEDILPPSLWSPVRRRVNASYYFLVGEYNHLSNNAPRARELFEAAYNLDPNSVVAWKMIAAQAASGDVDDALVQAKRIVLLYPKSAELHALYGQLLAGKAENEKAIKQYQEALKLDPQRIEAYLGLIDIYRSRNQMGKSISIAQRLVKVDPDLAEGWAVLAKLYLGDDQKGKALQAATRAYDLQSNDPEKIILYALTLELNGQAKKAVSLYEAVFRMNPTNEELIARMVDIYSELGDPDDALRLVEEAEVNSRGKGPGIPIIKAFLLWREQRYEEASNILSGLAKRYPRSDRIRFFAAQGHQKMERFEEAIKDYENVAKESPFYIHAQYYIIQIHRAQKHYDAALDRALAMIEMKGERAVDFYNIAAAIHDEQDRPDEALKLLKTARDEFPDDVQILFLLGVYQEKAGERSACIATMREVIAKDPKHSSAHNYLGYLFAEKGENLDEAEALIKKALELKPQDGFYKDSLGWVYYQKRDYQRALKTLQEALTLAPDEGVILEHIADCYRALNDLDKAHEYYEKAVKGRLDKRDRERVESKLQKYQIGSR